MGISNSEVFRENAAVGSAADSSLIDDRDLCNSISPNGERVVSGKHFDHGGLRYTSSFKSRNLCDEAKLSMMRESEQLEHNIMIFLY